MHYRVTYKCVTEMHHALKFYHHITWLPAQIHTHYSVNNVGITISPKYACVAVFQVYALHFYNLALQCYQFKQVYLQQLCCI